jgi:hypothetical protein
MTKQCSCLAVLATAGAVSLALAGAAAAQPCAEAVEATKAEWLFLTHGNHLAPSQPVITSDGRHLTGVLLNYVGALVDRAERACAAAGNEVSGSSAPAPVAASASPPQSEAALAYVREAEGLLHPAPR